MWDYVIDTYYSIISSLILIYDDYYSSINIPGAYWEGVFVRSSHV